MSAVEESEYTLLILTPAYQASEWNRFTEAMASFASVESGRNGVIPVLLTPGTAPLSIRALSSLDCTKENKWESEFSRLRELLRLTAPVIEPIPCPYPGMKPYNASLTKTFFGREKETVALVSALKRQNFLILVGALGCGKSSLVFAGVRQFPKKVAGSYVKCGPEPRPWKLWPRRSKSPQEVRIGQGRLRRFSIAKSASDSCW